MPLGNPIQKQNNTRIVSATATAGQVQFTITGGYTINAISVYRNGVRLSNADDFTASDGSTVSLNVAADVGDSLDFHIFDKFTVSNAIVSAASTQAISGNLNVTGSLYATTFRPDDIVTAGNANLGSLNVSGISTLGIATVSAIGLDLTGTANVTGVSTFNSAATFKDDVTLTGSSYNAVWDKTDNALEFGDNAKIKVGSNADLNIYHDGNSYISNAVANQLAIQSDDLKLRSYTGTEKYLTATVNGAVILYHDDSTRLTTTNTGVDIGSNINVAGIATVAGNLSIADSIIHTGDTDTKIRFPSGDDISFETAGSQKFAINSTGTLTSSGADAKLNVTNSGTDATETTSTLQTSNSGTHNQVTIKTSTNNGGDPYLKFDGGGQDMIVGTRYVGTTNNLLVLGPGNNPDTTSGIFVKGTGVVGVGTDNPAYQLDCCGDGGAAFSAITNSTNGVLSVVGKNSSGSVSAISRVKSYPDGSSNQSHMAFETRNSSATMVEAMRITSNQKVIIGHTAAPYSDSDPLQVVTTDAGTGIIIDQYAASSWSGSLSFLKSRNASIGGNTIVQDGDRLADFNFYGNDGAGRALGAQIGVRVDGTPGSDDMPSRIVFSTSADGSQSPTERLRISADGGVRYYNYLYGADNKPIYLGASNDFSLFHDASGGNHCVIRYNHAVGDLRFKQNDNTVVMNLDASGRLLIGNSTSLFGDQKLQVTSTSSTGSILLGRWSNSNYSSYINFYKSRATNINDDGSGTIVQSGDILGDIAFYGDDATANRALAAEIMCIVNGSPGTDDMPGKLQFKTSNDGSDTPTTRMEVSEGGVTTYGPLDVQCASSSTVNGARFYNTTNNTSANMMVQLKTYANGGGDNYIHFDGGGSNMVVGQFYGGGVNNKVMMGTGDSPSGGVKGVHVDGSGNIGMADGVELSMYDDNSGNGWSWQYSKGSIQQKSERANGWSMQYMNISAASSGSDDRYIQFLWTNDGGNATVGSIVSNGSNVTYNTSSDYRLKENVVDLTGAITRLKQLKPKRFNWIKDETNTAQDGFLAHEAQSVVPVAVSGTKDQVVTQAEVDADVNFDGKPTGTPIYQSMDYGLVTPLLTAALQEAIAKIETLEAKVAALESS